MQLQQWHLQQSNIAINKRGRLRFFLIALPDSGPYLDTM